MRLDPFSNPVFDEKDLLKALYQGHELSHDMFVEQTAETKKLEDVMGRRFWAPLDEYDISLEEYDSAMQSDWHMPDSYKNMDIEEWLYSQGGNNVRVSEELEAFKARNMLDLLRWLKYFVDTCTKEGIVWGVGRGSSVASYVLYLIGVHSIDSVKYNLDWQEFLR
jgi:DNA polymerase III alpha subunit